MPEISLKYKIIGGVIALLVAFASGRYSVNSPTIKTHETINTQTQVNQDKDTHKKVTITKKPDGTIITDISVDTDTKTDEKQNQNLTLDQTVTPPKKNTLNVSVLGGYDFGRGPVYGGSVTKQIIGPITAGVFGLTNGTIGVTVGLDF